MQEENASGQTTEAQPYMHADYLAEVWQAYPTAGALIEWQQQEIERLRTTIEDIAHQNLTSEMDEDQQEHADYEGAYNHIITLCRVSLGQAMKEVPHAD